jgi:glycosyltransferase involved in cell wall biosynthesis
MKEEGRVTLRESYVSSRRLLICSPSYARKGGVESAIEDLCHELPKRGWETLLALGEGSRFNDVGAYRKAYPDLPIKEIDGTKGTRQSRLESLRRVFQEVQPDIIFSARVFDAYEVVASMKERHLAPRLAIGIGGYEPHYLYDVRLFRGSVDLCVVMGNLLAAALTGWAGVDSSRVVSIPGGVRSPKSPPQPRDPGEKLRIGYVGRLAQKDKSILDLVPFLAHLEERGLAYHVSIVGDGPEGPVLREMLKSYVSNDRVTFCGWKERGELYQTVYPNLDCVVHFSPAEGVPISGGEAMAHGVVPVMSRFIGLKTERQYVHEFNSLIFPVGDVAAAAANVERLAAEPGLLHRLSENAIRSHTGKYTFDGAMDAWAEALDRCMELPPMIGPVPKLSLPADGRLARMGLSPRAAQRLRDLLGRRQVHNDPGSEWPTGSGLLTEDAAAEIMRFAADCEKIPR